MAENNGPGKSNFSAKHDDINLTKEETEFLEAQFLKYLSREMEKDPSNWGQFYDILKEETAQAGSQTPQGNSPTSNRKFDSHHQGINFYLNFSLTVLCYTELNMNVAVFFR